MIYKRSEQEKLQKELDLEKRHEPINRMQFWWGYMFDKLSNRLHELSYFTYMLAKFKHRKRHDEAENIDSNVMLDSIEMDSGQLTVNG